MIAGKPKMSQGISLAFLRGYQLLFFYVNLCDHAIYLT